MLKARKFLGLKANPNYFIVEDEHVTLMRGKPVTPDLHGKVNKPSGGDLKEKK
jgi:hypothetical protein